MSYTIILKKPPSASPITDLKAQAAHEKVQELKSRGYKEGRDFKITGPSGDIDAYYLERAVDAPRT